MTHVRATRGYRSPVDREWLAVGRDMATLANEWAHRSDLTVHLTTVKAEAVAMFIPAYAEIEVNTKAAFGKTPAKHIGDLTQKSVQYDFPEAMGALFHEAMHARFSTWEHKDLAGLTAEERDAFELLEESRIEGLGLRDDPKKQVFIRSFVLKLIVNDYKGKEEKHLAKIHQAAHSAALVLGRVDAGVLRETDVTRTRAVIETVIEPDIFEQLQNIWREFQALVPGPDTKEMKALARDWVALVNRAAKTEEEKQKQKRKENGEDENENETGLTPEELALLEEFLKELMDAMGEDGADTSIETGKQIADQQQEERMEESAKKKQEESREQSENEQVRKRVFSQDTSNKVTSSRVTSVREPLAEERAAAVKIGQLFDKAKYRDRIKTVTADALPPGRLKARVAVQGAALRSKGLMNNTEPWQRTHHAHVEDPTLKVGTMVDISGSMGGAMAPMASTAWVLSEALHRIQGEGAMVYFGQNVFPTLKVGQRLHKVTQYSAPDAWEDFDTAFRALDGELNLLYGRGARLLVVVSDGNFRTEPIRAAEKWLKRCQAAGVAVLWIGYGNPAGAESLCNGTDAVLVRPTGDLTSDAIAIGRAGAEALSKAGARANG